LVLALSIAALALTAGLAVACFVRAFGITFLALPRTAAVEQAHEPQWTMRVSMMVLAAACVMLGVVPVAVLQPLTGVIHDFMGARPDLTFSIKTIVTATDFGAVSPLWVAWILGPLMIATWIGLKISGANSGRRFYETWGCGRAVQTARFEYTATAFANPFKRVFAFLYRPVEHTQVEAHPESGFFVKTITYRSDSRTIIEDSVYAPIGAAVRRISMRTRAFQSGNVHGYLLYMLVALIVVLVWAKL